MTGDRNKEVRKKRAGALKRKQKHREQQEIRLTEQAKDTENHKRARQNAEFREPEKVRDAVAHTALRRNQDCREAEKCRDTKAHATARLDKEFREAEQVRDTASHQRARQKMKTEWEFLLNEYHKTIEDGADYICCCCSGLFYRASIRVVSNQFEIEQRAALEKALHSNCRKPHQLCLTCYDTLKQGKTPTLSQVNGLSFPEVPPVLKNLTDLEERLVAARIPFMQIRSLGSGGQFGLRGNVVNVVNDVDLCTSCIPRTLEESKTVQIMFMRQMKSKSPVFYETVRPAHVMAAAQYLMSTELYQEEGIVLSSNWQEEESHVNGSSGTTTNQLAAEDTESSNDSSDDEGDAQQNAAKDGQDSMLLQEEDLFNTVIKLAPGEGKQPVSLLYDLNAEVLSFPRIYGGIARIEVPGIRISATDRAKWEARSVDRRACTPAKLFFTYKRLLLARVAAAITLCLRKKKNTAGASVTVGQLRNSDFVASLIQHDDGFRVLKGIRSSPAYWETQLKKVMAMIRQVSIPGFFITLSAAETRWPELLIQLYWLAYGIKLTPEEVLNLPWEQKSKLIREDPITCARHFDHRFRAFLNLLLKPAGGVFAPYMVTDWYSRFEFQLRGSVHDHMLVWIPNPPRFNDKNPESLESCVHLIDNYISCDRMLDNTEMEKLVQLQLHRHSHTCRKKSISGRSCRFGFPIPPMPWTTILTPLPEDTVKETTKTAKQNFEKLTTKLTTMGRQFREVIPFSQFLGSLSMSMTEYTEAIRSSLKRCTVFLRRSTNAAYINPYNPKILSAWKANMDIQFVVDQYACAKYVVSYINKTSGGVSKLLREANADIRRGNTTLKERLRKFGNVFNNFSEISAQEAAIGVLGIPMVNCSRDDVFINTNIPTERTLLIKSKKELDDLTDESEDIAASSLIDKYVRRPEELENTCLADFASLYTYSRSQPPGLNYLKLQGHGFLIKRIRRLIIRYRKFGREADPANYFREQLMLFYPWRNEDLELLSCNSEEKYRQHADKIGSVKQFYTVDNWEEMVESAIQDQTTGAIEEEQRNVKADVVTDCSEYYADVAADVGSTKSSVARSEYLLSPKFVRNTEYHESLRNLNTRQRQFLLQVVHQIKTNHMPFYYFLSGGAGVGKTHVILAMVQTILRFFAKQPGQHLNNVWVTVCAPTGKAAFKLRGMTLHHCWRLPPSQYGGKIAHLDEDTCNSLRVSLADLKLVIIDEVSMMSVQQMHQVDSRLRQIFQSDLPFGGKSLLVVGHLRQLEPVGGSMVFTIPKSDPVGYITGNYLWEYFRLFELTEVMRQKGDDLFCNALNNMAEGTMTDEDVELIKAREVSATNKPPDNAIALYYSNADCQTYNDIIHKKLTGSSAISIAFDRTQGNGTEDQKASLLEYARTLSTGDADGLPYSVPLKVGAIYFVSTNVDVSDGIFNGSTGTLVHIVMGMSATGPAVLRVFLAFDDPTVGTAARENSREYQVRSGFDLTWTPIERYTRVLQKSGRNHKLQIVRTQIPLVAANGMTVHKSQGSDMALVVVNVKKKLRRALLYVACSRATTYKGLYIDGSFEPPKPPPNNDPVTLEMNRLRQLEFPFSFQFFHDMDDSVYKIVFQNVQSLHAHSLDIQADHSIMAADILAFVEPWLLPGEVIDFPEFKCVQRTDCIAKTRNSYGSVVFAANTLTEMCQQFEVQSHMVDKSHVNITKWRLGNVTFLMVYKSPGYPIPLFVQHLTNLLKQQDYSLPEILLGDFNLAYENREGKELVRLVESFGLFSQLPFTSTTDHGTCLDYCFSNIENLKAWLYESLYSYHKPICIVIPKENLVVNSKSKPSSKINPHTNANLQSLSTSEMPEKLNTGFASLSIDTNNLADNENSPILVLPAVTLENASRTHWHVEGIHLSLNDLKTIPTMLPVSEMGVLHDVARSYGETFSPGFLTDAIIDCGIKINIQNTSSLALTALEVQMLLGPDGQVILPGQWGHLDFVFLPLHYGLHWMLLVVCPKQQKVLFLDPAGTQSDSQYAILTQSLLQKINGALLSNIQLNEILNPPKQNQIDSYNCGVFVIWYIFQLAHGQPITKNLSPEDFRRVLLQQLWTHSQEFLATVQ